MVHQTKDSFQYSNQMSIVFVVWDSIMSFDIIKRHKMLNGKIYFVFLWTKLASPTESNMAAKVLDFPRRLEF